MILIAFDFTYAHKDTKEFDMHKELCSGWSTSKSYNYSCESADTGKQEASSEVAVFNFEVAASHGSCVG